MEVPEIHIALRAMEDGEISRDDLRRLLAILDSWERADLRVSCAELLTREFRVAPAKVRRWESEARGQPSRRIGKYELRRRVGRGGMGIVFEASHPNFDRPVALKILPPSLGKDPDAIQRFLTEVKSAGRFNHPNIVHAYDAGIDGDVPFLVMEFIDGENLFQVLQRSGPISVDQARDWLRQAGRALSVLEDTGWIHGDVKPSNWILADGGTLKLADLGLCRPPGAPRIEGTVFGSPPYIAPELLRRGGVIDIRADLYSLGGTFYHLLAGRPPYEASNVHALARLHKQERIVSLGDRCPELPADLVAVVDRLLARNPEDRFCGCADLLVTLGEGEAASPDADVAKESPVREAAPPASTASSRDPRGQPAAQQSMRGWLLALGVVVPLVAGVWFLWSHRTGATPDDRGESVPEVLDPEGASKRERVDDASSAESARVGDVARDWQSRLDVTPRPYGELLDWLAELGPDHAEQGRWKRELDRLLEAEAGPLWTSLRQEVDDLLSTSRFERALSLCASFPQRLQVGRFLLSLEGVRTRVMDGRQRYLAGIRLEIEADLLAGDLLGARSQFRGLGQLDRSDAAWFRDEVRRAYGGLPWAARYESQRETQEQESVERRSTVLSLLRGGVAPSPRFEAGFDFVLEAAVYVLHEHPSVLAPERDRWRALFDEGLLAEVSTEVLAEVLRCLSSLEEIRARDLAKECEAARHAAGARAACSEWDTERAEEHWAALQIPRLAGTLAVEALQGTLDVDKRELRHGVFLRGDAFEAEVSLRWGERPSLRYDFGRGQPLREWRARASRWSTEQGGLRSTVSGTSSFEPLECAIPFQGDFTAHLALVPPSGDWRWAFSIGEEFLVLAHAASGEVAIAVARDLASAQKALQGETALWPTVGPELSGRDESNPVEVEVHRTAEQWTLRVGSRERSFPSVGPTPFAHWFSFWSTHDTWLGRATLTGTISVSWLDERRKAILSK